ncbi:MAG: hypothetical protein RMY28_025330, partial [Nostoc sp. ChiSLP01]|nr:hypothetical protein [Nostoc sp. CmiSLP01]
QKVKVEPQKVNVEPQKVNIELQKVNVEPQKLKFYLPTLSCTLGSGDIAQCSSDKPVFSFLCSLFPCLYKGDSQFKTQNIVVKPD